MDGRELAPLVPTQSRSSCILQENSEINESMVNTWLSRGLEALGRKGPLGRAAEQGGMTMQLLARLLPSPEGHTALPYTHMPSGERSRET